MGGHSNTFQGVLIEKHRKRDLHVLSAWISAILETFVSQNQEAHHTYLLKQEQYSNHQQQILSFQEPIDVPIVSAVSYKIVA